MEQLNEFQMDALREICSISAGNAATAVSKMLGKKIEMSVPEIKLVPVTHVTDFFGNPETLIAGVYCKVFGDISGGFLLTFPRESACALCDVLLGKKTGETKILGELDRSALSETSNIITATFVGALAKIMNKTMLISVPRFAFDMAGAIIDFLLIELAEVAEYAVVLEIIFYDVPETVKGKFFILPDPGSLQLLLAAVDNV